LEVLLKELKVLIKTKNKNIQALTDIMKNQLPWHPEMRFYIVIYSCIYQHGKDPLPCQHGQEERVDLSLKLSYPDKEKENSFLLYSYWGERFSHSSHILDPSLLLAINYVIFYPVKTIFKVFIG
jgi:hypothetical protein